MMAQSALTHKAVWSVSSIKQALSRTTPLQTASGTIMDKMETGLPSAHLVAMADRRYLHRYYYDAASEVWSVVIDCKIVNGMNHWAMRSVMTDDGLPVGHVRKVTTDLWANRFADRPFDVEKTQEEFVWFCALANLRYASKNAKMLYGSYLERRKISSSFEALVRIGIRKPAK